jgi:Ser/Thr protein kinase RdoA (MazF antagonist)
MRFDRPHVSNRDVIEILELFTNRPLKTWRDVSGVPNCTVLAEFFIDSRMIIRICNNGYTSEAHLAAEVDVLCYLAKKDYRYSPRLIPGIDGRYVQAWNGYRVIAMHYVPGHHPDPSQMSARQYFELGVATALLTKTLESCPVSLTEAEQFYSRTDRLVVHASSHWASYMATTAQVDLLGMWWKCREVLENSRAPVGLIHTDIWPPNVIAGFDGQIAAIVDFDDMAHGPEVMDLAAALAEFAVIGAEADINASAAEAIVAGYITKRSLDGSEIEVIDTCMVASYVNWLACNIFHGVSETESKVYASRLQALVPSSRRAQFGETLSEMVGKAAT